MNKAVNDTCKRSGGKNDLTNKRKKGCPEQYKNCKDYPDTKLAHKLSSKFFLSAKHKLEIFMFLAAKRSRWGYYRNWKREAKDFEKVYPNTSGQTFYCETQILGTPEIFLKGYCLS